MQRTTGCQPGENSLFAEVKPTGWAAQPLVKYLWAAHHPHPPPAPTTSMRGNSLFQSLAQQRSTKTQTMACRKDNGARLCMQPRSRQKGWTLTFCFASSRMKEVKKKKKHKAKDEINVPIALSALSLKKKSFCKSLFTCKIVGLHVIHQCM